MDGMRRKGSRTNNVQIRRPVPPEFNPSISRFSETHGAHVAGQFREPCAHRVVRIPRPGNPSPARTAADRNILQTFGYGSLTLLKSKMRLHESRLIFVKGPEHVLISRKPEEVTLFRNQGRGSPADRTIGHLCRPAHVDLVVSAIAALVGALINSQPGMPHDAPEKSLDRKNVSSGATAP